MMKFLVVAFWILGFWIGFWAWRADTPMAFWVAGASFGFAIMLGVMIRKKQEADRHGW